MAGENKTYPDRNTPYKFRRDSATHLDSEIYTDCMMRGITSHSQKVGARGCGPPGAPKDNPKKSVVTDRQLGDLQAMLHLKEMDGKVS